MKYLRKKRIRHLLLVILVCFVFVASFLFWGNDKATSSAHINAERYVKSVLICSGDTLWSIASEYYTELDGELEDYIEEIKLANRLETPTIHAGNYILIPYFEF